MALTVGGVAPGEAAAQTTTKKMHWTDPAVGKIRRGPLDGSGVQDLMTTELSYLFRIALDLSVSVRAHGFQPTKAVCMNLTTKKKVKITLPPGALFSDCAAARPVVRASDKLKMTITGSEP